MAEASEMAQAPGDIFRMLDNADIKFPTIKDEDGKEIELTKGRYMTFMESENRRVRESAFKALYSTYEGLINTLGATTAANIKSDVFYKKQRNFNSCLEASLFQDNVTVDVYDNPIKAVNSRLDLLHRYVDLRKRALGVKDLHMYDLYVPLIRIWISKLRMSKQRIWLLMASRQWEMSILVF